jgi:hypothetical protein
MYRFEQFLALRGVSERNLRGAAEWLEGYVKFTSMVWIRALRQPILDGLVVKRGSRESDEAVKSFCRSHHCNDVLLRIDMPNQRWSKRRGGYTVPASKAQKVIRELSTEGRIAAFLEPLSPYCDQYCLAAITDEAQERMTVEVVGPGFDASDLLRSDTQPHERFEVFLPVVSGQQPAVFAQRKFVMGAEDYRRTVLQRLVKIGARLKNPAYPETILELESNQRNELANDAEAFLIRTKQALLLKHPDEYEPIPRGHLERFASGVKSIVHGLERHGIRLGATAFSGTFTPRGRFVFWDFFPADLKKAKALWFGR